MPSINAATILVVEEEPQLLELLQEILLRGGHRVLRARSGAEGIRLYEQHGSEVDLLVVDGYQPEVDALAGRHPGLKVLALSADRAPQIPVLPKPFGPDDLLLHVRWLLAQR
jgi:CheY-like chemotaxis protein